MKTHCLFIKRLIASFTVVGLMFSLMDAGAASAAAINANVLYINQEQIVAMPTKNIQQVLLVDTIQLYNGSGQAKRVEVPLLQGLTNVRFLGGSTTPKQVSNQLLVVQINPGMTSFSIQASVPFQDQGATLVLSSPLAVRSFFVAIPEGALALSAQGGFETVSTTFIANHMTFRRFAKLDLQPNTPWQMSMTMLPTANGKQAKPLPGLPVLNSYNQNSADFEAATNLVLAVMILAVGIVSIRRSGQTRRRVSPVQDATTRELLRAKDDLMKRWLDLEDQHDAREVTDPEYEAQRAIWKDKVVDVELSLRADRG